MGQLWVQSLALPERREHLQTIFRGYSAMQCILLLFKIWGLSLYLKKKITELFKSPEEILEASEIANSG